MGYDDARWRGIWWCPVTWDMIMAGDVGYDQWYFSSWNNFSSSSSSSSLRLISVQVQVQFKFKNNSSQIMQIVYK